MRKGVAGLDEPPGRQVLLPDYRDEIESFFKEQAPKVFRYAYLLSQGNRALAEDAVQDAFMAAAKSWEQVRTRSNQDAWLRAIIRNKIIDSWRHASQMRTIEPLVGNSPTPDTATEAINRDILTRAFQLIQQMPAMRSRVLMLRFREGFSVNEIADMLGINPSTVRTHLKHGRDMLLPLLGEFRGDDILVPRIDFDRLAPGQYEHMVSVLLSRLRQARRVDGSGGDEGRDCYFTDENGTDVYELKSFTGRMTAARRRQVQRSLARAIKARPRAWTLVVPIDPTPAEQRWFDSLGAALPLKLEWLGKTWLEGQLTQFPEITRYFSGAADEVVEILKEISREDPLPVDAVRLARQFTGRVGRLNELDPHYRFEFGITEGATVVTAYPRYPDAERDRPIRVTATLQFDDPPGQTKSREAFTEFMKFGTPVTISAGNITQLTVDAPAGLGGEFPGGILTLDGTFPLGSEQAAAFLLRTPAQPPIRQVISLTVTGQSSGPAGGLRILARDRSGLLTLEQHFDTTRRTYQAHLDYKHQAAVLPQDAVPVLRFCAAVAAGEEMAITDTAGNMLATSSGTFGQATWPEVYIRCAEVLAEVQQLSGTAFPLPLVFTPEDQRDLNYARAILRGEDVQAQWSGMIALLPTSTVDNLLAQLEEYGESFSFATATPETLQVAGGQLPLGSVLHIMHSTRIANLDEVRYWRRTAAEAAIEVRFEPANSRDMTVRAAPTADTAANEQPKVS